MWTVQDRAFIGDFGCGQALSDEQYGVRPGSLRKFTVRMAISG